MYLDMAGVLSQPGGAPPRATATSTSGASATKNKLKVEVDFCTINDPDTLKYMPT